MTPLISELVKLAPSPELLHWFDLGDVSDHAEVLLDVVNESPLPYDKCAIVGLDGQSKFLLVLHQVDDVVAYIGYDVHPNNYDKHPAFTYRRTPSGLQLHAMKGEATPSKELARVLLATVALWLGRLSPETKAHVPKARPSLINSKRAAKGKGPVLFDWHTVTVTPRPNKSEHQGETHASPRLHDRRGHWRKYPSGKVGWVKACKVGDSSRGVIFKDYEVKA